MPLLADHPKARLARQLAEVGRPCSSRWKVPRRPARFWRQHPRLDRDSALLDAEATGDPERRAGPESSRM